MAEVKPSPRGVSAGNSFQQPFFLVVWRLYLRAHCKTTIVLQLRAISEVSEMQDSVCNVASELNASKLRTNELKIWGENRLAARMAPGKRSQEAAETECYSPGRSLLPPFIHRNRYRSIISTDGMQSNGADSWTATSSQSLVLLVCDAASPHCDTKRRGAGAAPLPEPVPSPGTEDTAAINYSPSQGMPLCERSDTGKVSSLIHWQPSTKMRCQLCRH